MLMRLLPAAYATIIAIYTNAGKGLYGANGIYQGSAQVFSQQEKFYA